MEVHENLRDLERDPASPGVPVAPVEVPVRMSAKCSGVGEKRMRVLLTFPKDLQVLASHTGSSR